MKNQNEDFLMRFTFLYRFWLDIKIKRVYRSLIKKYKISKQSIDEFIYYSHSMKIYRSQCEKDEIALISQRFPKKIVINPSNINFLGLPGANIMDICFFIVKNSAITIFSEYMGFIGKGVYDEIIKALNNKKEVLLIRKEIFYSISKKNLRLFDQNDWKIRYAQVINIRDL